MKATKVLFRNREESLWNFWEHGVTSSFIDLFLTCREQTRLTFVQGWSAKGLPLAIEFGSCCHWVLEQIYDGLGKKHEYEHLSNAKVIHSLVDTYAKQWLANIPLASETQLDQQAHAYALAKTILPHYMKRWDGDFLEGKYTHGSGGISPRKWTSLEEIFSVPYVFPDGQKTVIRGRRDGVFLDKTDRSWVFDTKCRSVIMDGDIIDTMPFDPQFMLYIWATWKQNKTFPAGVVQNVIRRPGQRPSAYSSLSALTDKVEAEVKKKYDYYFIRYVMPLGSGEIQEWEKNFLDPVMQEVRGWWDGTLPHYANYRNLTTKYGRCQMFIPITKGDFAGHYKRDKVFNEL